jgi:hypothetical protein
VPDDVWPDRAAALRASGRPPAGFRGLRRGTHNSQECRKTPQDAGRGQPPRSLRTLQRQSCVGDDGARQPELGVGGQDQPGPSVGLLGMTHPRHRPAQGLFHEAIACSRSNLREYALQMSPGPPLPLRSTTTRASWVCGSACATCPPRPRPRSPAPRAPFRNRSARLSAGSWGCKPDQHLSRTEP